MKIAMPDLLSRISQLGLDPERSSPRVGEEIFAKILSEVNTSQRQADMKIRESLLGRADLHEVMLSLESADMGLKVLVQIRNKMIQAYEELSRMNM